MRATVDSKILAILYEAFIVLDDNGDVVDYRDTLEVAMALAEDRQQDDEDMWAANDVFESADN